MARPRAQSAVLTPKRKAMADALLEGARVSDAVRAADIHPGYAYPVMRNDEVKAYLARAREEIEDISTLRRCDVLNLFIEAIDMARSLSDPANMINGTDKIAKMLGYYAPETKRIELSGEARELNQRIQSMSDKELLELIARRRAPVTIDASTEETHG